MPHYENPNNPNLFYGCLYNWPTVMNLPKRFIKELWEEESSRHQGIAPEGWHIPNSREWEIWEEQLGMHLAPQIKASYGWANMNNSDNTVGFEALAAGCYFLGRYHFFGEHTFWWETSQYNKEEAYYRQLQDDWPLLNYCSDGKGSAYSCRCLRYVEEEF